MDSARPWRLSHDQRRDLWRRWREGQTLTEIATALSVTSASVFSMVRRSGGYSPPDRTGAERSLTATDREEISRGLAVGASIRRIALRIGRAASTISREVARNGGRDRYRPGDADTAAWARARRPKECLLARQPRLRDAVAHRVVSLGTSTVANAIGDVYREQAAQRFREQNSFEALFLETLGPPRCRSRRSTSPHLRSPNERSVDRGGLPANTREYWQ
jgi:transposase-like protein